jgi:diacylglycerol kinase family enzyme
MTDDPAGLVDALERGPELVVAAGGDGTVSTAARALAGHPIPLAMLPLGTANNIARALRIEGPIAELIAHWKDARRMPLDLGRARLGSSERTFVEGAGVGLISRAIATLDSKRTEPGMPVRTYREILAGLTPRPFVVRADGERIEGEFLLVEVLNIDCVGPNVLLAPGADPSDGWLDLVLAGPAEREMLDAYLRHRSAGTDRAVRLPVRRVRHVELARLDEIHLDDEVRSGPSLAPVSIEVEPAALDVLV